ncbi:MAG: Na+/H+ antiporter subunit D [Caldilineaceae bacterium]
MNWLLISPILIPLFTAIFMLLLWRQTAWKRWLGVVGAVGLLGTGLLLLTTVWQQGILAGQVGNWPAPFGITLVADLLSALMVVLIGVVGAAAAIYALASVDEPRQRFGFHPLLQILLMGLCGAVLTGDLFNLFVWFEVMLITSFVLISLGGQRDQIEGGLKYVTLNLFASAMFLTAAGIVYGVAGTLNLADLAVRFADPAQVAPGVVTTIAMLFLIAFGIKAAIFPLFFWLPASYHTTSVLVSAIFAGLLTKVGVYALIRVFTLLFVQEPGYTHQLLLIIAGVTMVVGVLGAAAQNEIRRILSFHIVSQIGYMIMGLALLTPLALAGAIFFLAHNILVKLNLFLIGGLVQRLQGSEQLKKLGGLYTAYPGVAVLFLLSALALAGLPPLSGFWAKYLLVRAGLEIQHYGIVAVSLAVSLLTLFSMLKIWQEAFWKAPVDPAYAPQAAVLTPAHRLSRFGPIVLLAILTVGMGIAVEPLFGLVQSAADQLLTRTGYITAVLGAAPALPPVIAVESK